MDKVLTLISKIDLPDGKRQTTIHERVGLVKRMRRTARLFDTGTQIEASVKAGE
jgi:hypothetical protein